MSTKNYDIPQLAVTETMEPVGLGKQLILAKHMGSLEEYASSKYTTGEFGSDETTD